MMSVLMLFACLSFGQIEGVQAESDKQALITRIKESLTRIDEALMEAAEVDAVSDELSRVKQSHLDAIRDIEELINQLEYQFVNPQGGGSGGGGGGSDGGEGSESESQPRGADARNQQRSPGSSGGTEEQPAGNDPTGEEQPTDGQPAGQPESHQQLGNTVPPDATDTFSREDTDGRWGLLPPKVQEQLNNMHVDDVPERYRSWLDAYIKAMRRLEEP
jgi:hypothetical protein